MHLYLFIRSSLSFSILPFAICPLSASQVPLTFSNSLSPFLPPLKHQRLFLRGQLVQRRPIYFMLIHKINIPAMGFQELDRWNKKPQIVVEFQFLAGCWVDEGVDEFKEGLHDPGYYTIKSLLSWCPMKQPKLCKEHLLLITKPRPNLSG